MTGTKTARKALGTKRVEALLREGAKSDHSAGNGLYLKVSGKASGSWYFRYKVEDKAMKHGYKVKRLGFGSAGVIGLAGAREKAAEQRALLSRGIDPQQDRQEKETLASAEVVTFDMVAADYIKAQRISWTNAKHASQWVNTLATYASPVIGHITPADITTEHLLKILSPIWNTKKETASRVRNRIEIVLNAAKARKLRTGENVAAWRGHLELLLAKHKGSDVKHHPALPWPQIGAFWKALEKDQGISAQALQLTILTGLRTSEILGANWSEFDLAAAVWSVPASRMKTKKDHRVPLSSTALELLAKIPKVSSGLLFEGRTEGKAVSNMVMLMKARRMDEAKHKLDSIGWRGEGDKVITPHGFRSTFRDWAAENTPFENIVVEQALAHTIGNAVEQAYRRGDLLERRRELMQAWANSIGALEAGANVVAFKRVTA